jgi:hypothetical protein
MAAVGTSRHFAATQQFGRIQTEADIKSDLVAFRPKQTSNPIYEYAPWGANYKLVIEVAILTTAILLAVEMLRQ